MEEEISIGPVTMIPYEKLKEMDRSPAHSEIYNWLDRYFELYTDGNRKPVDTITIFYIGDLDFKPQDETGRGSVKIFL